MNKLVTSLCVALGLSLLSSPARADGFAGWTYAEQPSVPLSRATITPFDDGSALLVGASLANGQAQEYSSVTGRWVLLGTPLFPRVRHAAVGLPGRKVLLCGGAEFSPPLWYTEFRQVAEIYDHASRTFTKTGEMRSRRIGGVAALSCDDRTEPIVLVTGGGDKWPDLYKDSSGPKGDPDYGSILNSAEIYRLSTGQWESAPPMSTARFLHTATCIPGHGVLVVGGRGDGYLNPANGPTAQGIKTVELFDPATMTWKTVASLHQGRFAHAATLLSTGKVLVAGGEVLESPDSYLQSVELYDPETDKWTMLHDMTLPRTDHAQIALPNDQVLVAGGFTVDEGGQIATASVDVYEPVLSVGSAGSDAFERVPFPSMILPRAGFPMALLGGDTLFVASKSAVSSATEILRLSRAGVRCEHAFECQSGFCVDGVCCQSACGSACAVCSAANGSSADGVCQELSCGDHLSCTRSPGESPVCLKQCQSADQCEVGYACDPRSHKCVEPHSTFVSEGCSVGGPGVPSSGRGAWLAPALLALFALFASMARRARRAHRLAWLSSANLALLTSGCDSAGNDALCAPFTLCGESCVNPRIDRQNCGGCGIACSADKLCLDGACTLVCAGGTSRCGDRCVDVSVDPTNCGACGVACAGGTICDTGACALPRGHRSYIFPGGHAAGGVHPKEPRFLLVADAPATIHYTTDGSTPMPGQPSTTSGRSPLDVPPTDAPGVSQRRILWFADYDLLGPEAQVHSYVSVVDPAVGANFGALVEPPKLSPDGAPLLVVARGGDVQGTVGYQEWSSRAPGGYCPTCVFQLYVGLQGLKGSLACDSYFMNPYPGKEGTFSLFGKAPLLPGWYALRWWIDLDLECNADKAVSAVTEEVGLVVVY